MGQIDVRKMADQAKFSAFHGLGESGLARK
jgi:hypothetical protein